MPAVHLSSSRPADVPYSRAAVLVHWLLAGVLFAQVVLGWWMLGLPKVPHGLRAGWFNTHKSIGLTIAAIALVRIVWRTFRPARESAGIPPWQRHAARINHALLYLCMLALPLSGLLGSNFTVHPVLYFGLRLPGWNHDWPAASTCTVASVISNHAAERCTVDMRCFAAGQSWFQPGRRSPK
jgi:cytochrome b561